MQSKIALLFLITLGAKCVAGGEVRAMNKSGAAPLTSQGSTARRKRPRDPSRTDTDARQEPPPPPLYNRLVRSSIGRYAVSLSMVSAEVAMLYSPAILSFGLRSVWGVTGGRFAAGEIDSDEDLLEGKSGVEYNSYIAKGKSAKKKELAREIVAVSLEAPSLDKYGGLSAAFMQRHGIGNAVGVDDASVAPQAQPRTMEEGNGEPRPQKSTYSPKKSTTKPSGFNISFQPIIGLKSKSSRMRSGDDDDLLSDEEDDEPSSVGNKKSQKSKGYGGWTRSSFLPRSKAKSPSLYPPADYGTSASSTATRSNVPLPKALDNQDATEAESILAKLRSSGLGRSSAGSKLKDAHRRQPADVVKSRSARSPRSSILKTRYPDGLGTTRPVRKTMKERENKG